MQLCKKVVVVENESFIATDLEETLKRLDYNVVGVFDSGEAFLKFLKKSDKDFVVLCDIFLSGRIDGFKLARRLWDERIPVVFVSAYSDEKTFRKSLQTPVMGFIQKPYDEFTIKSSIEFAFKLRNQIENLEKRIESLSEKEKKLLKEIEIENEKFLKEKKCAEELFFEKEKLEKEIASVSYYVDLIKSEIQKTIIEKERLQNAKSEIFGMLSFYIKIFDFFDSLFCKLLRKEDISLQKQLGEILNEFVKVFDGNCKGIKLVYGGEEVKTSEFILTEFLLEKEDVFQKNTPIILTLYFNTNEELKEYSKKKIERFCETFLEVLKCFWEKKKRVEEEMKERFFYSQIFDAIPLPIIYSGKISLANKFAREFLGLDERERFSNDIIICNKEELKQRSLKILFEEKRPYFEYKCELKAKSGIIEARIRRSVISDGEKINGYVDIILI